MNLKQSHQSADLPLVSIITVNFNQMEVTGAFLESVRKLSYPNLEVILVDNGSVENPGSWLAEHYPEVRFIRSEKNLGFSGGNNLGLRQAKGTFFFFVNNDTELEQDAIELFLETFGRYPDAGVISPMLRYYEQPDLIQFAGYTDLHPILARNSTTGQFDLDRGQFSEVKETAFAHGAAMFIPRTVVEKVGMMSERFFLYFEEYDWSASIRKAGYRILVNPNIKVVHKESVSVGKNSELKTYYMSRNRILYMRRHTQGIRLFLFLTYYFIVVYPKSMLLFLLKGQLGHCRAFVKSLAWNLTNPARVEGEVLQLPKLSDLQAPLSDDQDRRASA